MIKIGFSDGSTLMEPGDLPEAVPAAVRSACRRLHVEFHTVTSIWVGETSYFEAQVQDLYRLLALEDALLVIEQYADPGNWSGIFNRQKTVQRRWKGVGEAGNELALSTLDRLRHYAPSYRGAQP